MTGQRHKKDIFTRSCAAVTSVAFVFTQVIGIQPLLAASSSRSWKTDRSASQNPTSRQFARLADDASALSRGVDGLSSPAGLVSRGLGDLGTAPLRGAGTDLFDRHVATGLPKAVSNLPLQFARVQDWHWAGEKAPLVIQLQNVHGHLKAQQNISSFIQSLAESRRIDWVALEGVSGPVDLTAYRRPSPEVRREAAGFLVRQGFLTGAESAALTSERTIGLVGVESPEPYKENVAAAKGALKIQADLTARLAAWRAVVRSLKDGAYSPDLLALDRSFGEYRAGRLPLGRHVEAMAAAAPSVDRPASVEAFLRAYRLESTLDFSRAESERSALLDELTRRLSEEELRQLLSATLQLRLGRLSQKRYYDGLDALCAARGVSLARYAAFRQYLTYVSLADSVGRSFFEDLPAYESRALGSLVRTAPERRLAAVSDDLDLMDKLAALSLTPTDWSAFAARRGGLRALSERLAALSPASALPTVSPEELSAFERFFERAEVRDRVMADRLLSEVRRRDSGTAVMVLGGFHSPGLSRRLRDAGLSYVVLSPELGEVDPSRAAGYLDSFVRPRTPLEALFTGERLTLEFVSALKPIDPSYGYRRDALEPLYAELTAAVDLYMEAGASAPDDALLAGLSPSSTPGKALRRAGFLLLPFRHEGAALDTVYVVMKKDVAERVRASAAFRSAVGGLREVRTEDGESLSLGVWTRAGGVADIRRHLSSLVPGWTASLAAVWDRLRVWNRMSVAVALSLSWVAAVGYMVVALDSGLAGTLLAVFVNLVAVSTVFYAAGPLFRYQATQYYYRLFKPKAYVPAGLDDLDRPWEELLKDLFPVSFAKMAAASENGLFNAIEVAFDPAHSYGPYAAVADTDSRGRHYRWLDFGQFGAKAVGDNRPEVAASLLENFAFVVDRWAQSDSQTTLSLSFKEMLARRAPKGMPKSFVINTGAESVENAIKSVIFRQQLSPGEVPSGKNAFLIHYEGAFHGRSLGALAATTSKKARIGFQTFDWPVVSFPGAHFKDAVMVDDEDLRASERKSLKETWDLFVTGRNQTVPRPREVFEQEMGDIEDFLSALYPALEAARARDGEAAAEELRARLVADFVREAREKIEARDPRTMEHADKVMGIIVEPVQGEGGIRFAHPRYFQQLRMLSLVYDVPILFDEVQTGYGMTGKLWAHEHFNLPAPPDVVTVAKKVQMGVVYVSDELAQFFAAEKKFNTTWEGEPVGMLRAMVYDKLMDLGKINELGAYTMEHFLRLEKKYPGVMIEPRGQGVMLAFNLPDEEWREDLVDAAFRRGLIINRAGPKTIRFYPRYDTKQVHIDEAIEILDRSFAAVVAKRGTPKPAAEPSAPAAAEPEAPVEDLPPAHDTVAENFIAGQWTAARGEGRSEVADPATGALSHVVVDSAADQVEAAAVAAERAYADWRFTSVAERAAYLLKMADILEGRQEEQARVIAREMGKTYAEALSEAAGNVHTLRAMAAMHGVEPEKAYAPTSTPEEEHYERFTSVGAMAIITPWNYPQAIAVDSLAEALLAGDTVVLKPSELATRSAVELLKAAHEAGLPAGVLNLVTGGRDVGRAVVENERLKGVSFTGSVEAGRDIKRRSAALDKRRPPRLELGGNNFDIVLPDADLATAVEDIFKGAFGLAGQVCMKTQRAIFAGSLPESAVQELVRRAKALKVGLPMEEGVQMGPVVSLDQLKKVEAQVESMKAKGGLVLAGGRRLGSAPGEERLAGGFFYAPTVILDTTADQSLGQTEEVFGPVLILKRAKDADHAIELANASGFGLIGAVHTADVAAAERDILPRLKTGRRLVNLSTTYFFGAGQEFGGYALSKTSLGSIEKTLGPAALRYWRELISYVEYRVPFLKRTGAAVKELASAAGAFANESTRKFEQAPVEDLDARWPDLDEHYIDGRWVKGQGTEWYDVKNPATGETLYRFLKPTAEEYRRASDSSLAALEKWRALSVEERAAVVYRIDELIGRNTDRLARIMSIEMGKRLQETRNELTDTVLTGDYLAAEHGVTDKKRTPVDTRGKPGIRSYIGHEGLRGVGGVITPWNYPIAIPIENIVEPLMAGVPMVWKPSENAMRTAVELTKIFEEAGVPAGVINLVLGSRETGQAMSEDDNVVVMAFTGSVPAARDVKARSASKDFRRFRSEGGGNNFDVVLPDAEVDPAVEDAILGSFALTGQQCIKTQRVFLVGDDPDFVGGYVAKLVDGVAKLKVGNGLTDGVDMGPIVNEKQLQTFTRQVNALLATPGARLLAGGRRLGHDESGARLTDADPRYDSEKDLAGGYFYAPTVIFDETSDNSLGQQEEIFGPILIVKRAKTMEEAIALGNAPGYGLSSAIHTTDEAAWERGKRLLHTGVRILNRGTAYLTPSEISFGGISTSLTALGGTTHILGPHALDVWEETYSVIVRDVPPAAAAAPAKETFTVRDIHPIGAGLEGKTLREVLKTRLARSWASLTAAFGDQGGRRPRSKLMYPFPMDFDARRSQGPFVVVRNDVDADGRPVVFMDATGQIASLPWGHSVAEVEEAIERGDFDGVVRTKGSNTMFFTDGREAFHQALHAIAPSPEMYHLEANVGDEAVFYGMKVANYFRPGRLAPADAEAALEGLGRVSRRLSGLGFWGRRDPSLLQLHDLSARAEAEYRSFEALAADSTLQPDKVRYALIDLKNTLKELSRAADQARRDLTDRGLASEDLDSLLASIRDAAEQVHGRITLSSKVIAFEGSYHGRTGMLGATWHQDYVEGFIHVPTPFVKFPASPQKYLRTTVGESALRAAVLQPRGRRDLEGLHRRVRAGEVAPEADAEERTVLLSEIESLIEMEREIEKGAPSETALVLVEPIQGEGGGQFATGRFFRALRLLTDEYDVPMLMDEIQVGFGITGKTYAHENFDLKDRAGRPTTPDFVSVSKSQQLSTIYFTPKYLPTRLYQSKPGDLFQPEDGIAFRPDLGRLFGTTWGGSGVDMMRATIYINKYLKEKESIEKHVEETGEYFRARLRELQAEMPELVLGVRGMGMFVVFDLPSYKLEMRLIEEALKNNLMLLGAGESSIRIPGYRNFEKEHIDWIVATIRKCLLDMRAEAPAPAAPAAPVAAVPASPAETPAPVDVSLTLGDRLRGVFYAFKNMQPRDVRKSAVEYVMAKFTEVPRGVTGWRLTVAKAGKVLGFIRWSVSFFWNEVPLAYKLMSRDPNAGLTSLWFREGKRFAGYRSTERTPAETVDAVVVGLGATGAALLNEFADAYRADPARHAGLRVVGLEIGEAPAEGASGRNGGFVISGKRLYAMEYDTFYSKLSKKHPDWSAEQVDAEARRQTTAMFHVMERNSDILDETVRKDGIEAHYAREGWLLIADSPAVAAGMGRSVKMGAEAGFRWEALSVAEMKERFGVEADQFQDEDGRDIPVSGLYQPKSATVHSGQLVWELVDRALAKGRSTDGRDEVVRVYTETGMSGYEELEDGTFLVHTPRGDIHTRKVIDARDSYTTHPSVKPYHGQIHTFDALPDGIRKGEGISKSYFYLRGYKGQLAIGSDHSFSETPGDDSISNLIRLFVVANLHRMFPSMRLNIVNEHAGTMGETPDLKPIVGPRDAKRNWYDVMGFSGHGFGFIFAAARETVRDVLDLPTEGLFPAEVFGSQRFAAPAAASPAEPAPAPSSSASSGKSVALAVLAGAGVGLLVGLSQMSVVLPVELSVFSDAFFMMASVFLADYLTQRLIERPARLDGKRLAYMAAVGLLSGVFLHFFYLDVVYGLVVHANPWVEAALRAAVDPGLLSAPYYAVVYLFIGLVRGESWKESKASLGKTLWPTVKTSWTIWFAIQFLNFAFVPQVQWILLINVVNLPVTMFISWLRHTRGDAETPFGLFLKTRPGRALSASGRALALFVRTLPAHLRTLRDLASTRGPLAVNPVGEGDLAAKLPRSTAWLAEWKARHNSGEPYYPFKAGFDRGQGPYWFAPDTDAAGDPYVFLDLAGSIAAEPFGYRFEPVTEAYLAGKFLAADLNKLSHTTALPQYAVEFQKAVDRIAPAGLSKRLFGNGGAEVVEAALRAANYHRPGRFLPESASAGRRALDVAQQRLDAVRGAVDGATEVALQRSLSSARSAFDALAGLPAGSAAAEVRKQSTLLKDALFDLAYGAETARLSAPEGSSLERALAELRAAAEETRGLSFHSFVIHFKGSYHGRSAAAVEVTESGGQSKGFEGRGWPAVDFPEMEPGSDGTAAEDAMSAALSRPGGLEALWRDVEAGRAPVAGGAESALLKRELQSLIAVERLIAADPAAARAVIVEPIQSEGGDRHASGRFFRTLRRLTAAHDVPLVLDEVQTGFGLTGSVWMHQNLGLTGALAPDMVTTAKSLQVPTLFYSDRYYVPERGLQGNTWQGTGTDMVRATVFIDELLREGALEDVRRVGAHFYAELKKLEAEYPELVSRVRGRDTGLFLSFDLRDPVVKARFLDRSFRNGLLMLGAGTRTVRIRGFRNLTAGQVDEAMALIRRSLSEVRAQAPAPAAAVPSVPETLVDVPSAPLLSAPHYIGGVWTEGLDPLRQVVVSPVTGETLNAFRPAVAGQVADAVSSAQGASDALTALSVAERAAIIAEAARLLDERAESVARVISEETGKSPAGSLAEVKGAVGVLRHVATEQAAEAAEALEPKGLSARAKGAFTTRRPLGVGGVIVPFNVPLGIAAWHIAPGVLYGNPLVYKPAEQTPRLAIELVRVFADAGLPAGALNLVQGGGLVGEALVRDPRVSGISFTGSTEVGRRIERAGASLQGRKSRLELGGNNVEIVMADAADESTAQKILAAAFSFSGQYCNHTQRVILVGDVPESFVDALRRGAEALVRSGNLEPLVSRRQLEKFLRQIDALRERGGEVAGGERLSGGEWGNGFYASPAVVVDRTEGRRLGIDEEIFGPAIVVSRAKDFAAAREQARDAEGYGLLWSLHTRDEALAQEALKTFEAGRLRINHAPVSASAYPGVEFGGLFGSASSLNSSDGVLGEGDLNFWTKRISVLWDRLPAKALAWTVAALGSASALWPVSVSAQTPEAAARGVDGASATLWSLPVVAAVAVAAVVVLVLAYRALKAPVARAFEQFFSSSSAPAAPAPGTGLISIGSALGTRVRFALDRPLPSDYLTEAGLDRVASWESSAARDDDGRASARGHLRALKTAVETARTAGNVPAETLARAESAAAGLESALRSEQSVRSEEMGRFLGVALSHADAASREELNAFLWGALPPVTAGLLPGSPAAADPEAFDSDGYADLLSLSLGLALGTLDEDERRWLPYATADEVAALAARRTAPTEASEQVGRQVRERVRGEIAADAATYFSPGDLSVESARVAAARLGFLHAQGGLLQSDDADASADAGRFAAAASAEQAFLYAALYAAAGAGLESFSSFRDALDGAYRAAGEQARALVESKTVRLSADAADSAASRRDAQGARRSEVSVFHVGGLLGRTRPEALSSLTDRIARHAGEAMDAEGGSSVPAVFVAEGLAASETARLREALFERLAAHPAAGTRDALALRRYLDRAVFVTTPAPRISPDWLFGVLQARTGLKSFTMNVFTTDASAWETDAWRKDLAWKLYLVVSEIEVVDVLKSVEEGLKAVRLLGTQA
jgi:betaine-aldehyde dehydrogenase